MMTLSGVKQNSSRGRPLDMSRVGEMGEEALNQESNNLNMTQTSYQRVHGHQPPGMGFGAPINHGYG